MFDNITLQEGVYIIIALLVSMTVHEFMHAYVGYKLGDDTASESGRLSLNPIRHIDPLMTIALPIFTLLLLHVPFLAAKPVPFDPGKVKFGEYGAALLAAAGPLSNLVLAILGVIIYNGLSSSVIASFLSVFIQLNVWMFIFNLIPIPPLDGSRVVYAFAPETVQEFMRTIERFGFFIIIILINVDAFYSILENIYNSVLNTIIKI